MAISRNIDDVHARNFGGRSSRRTFSAQPENSVRSPTSRLLTGYVIGAGLALVPYLFAAQDRYSTLDRALAWMILVVAGLPALHYAVTHEPGLPFAAMASATYAVAFSIPIFYESTFQVSSGAIYISDSAVTAALGLSLLALVLLEAGFFLTKRHPFVLKIRPLQFHLRPRKALAVAAVIILLWGLMEVMGLSMGWVPSQDTQQFLTYLAPIYAAEAILFVLYMQGNLGPWGGAIVASFLGVLLADALARGMLAALIVPVLVPISLAWAAGRPLKIRYFALIALILLILQPVKEKYREDAWYGSFASASISDRIMHFVDLAVDTWSDKIGDADQVADLSKPLGNRTSLLLATAQVIQETPERVPFREGKSYRYLLYVLVPRFLYPEKPIAQESNIWYAITFGITSKEGTRRTMFGISHIAEAWANFGLIGFPFIFFGLGIAYRFLHRILGTPGSGIGAIAVYAQILSQVPAPESSLASQLGLIIQAIVFYGILSFVLNDRGYVARRLAGVRAAKGSSRAVVAS